MKWNSNCNAAAAMQKVAAMIKLFLQLDVNALLHQIVKSNIYC